MRAAPARSAARGARVRRLALAALFVAAPLAAAAPPPEIVFEAPPELEPTRLRLEAVDPSTLATVARLVGLERPGEPIRVVLATEESPAAAEMPPWVSGYAYGSLGRVVLLPARVGAYPSSSLEELLRHEVSHVLLSRAAAGQRVPRWFDEGVAMLAAGSWSLEDRSRLTLALVTGARRPLSELDAGFAGGRLAVQSAYALSGAFVRYLFQSFGPEIAAAILRLQSVGMPFDEAFRRATGVELERVEEEFWRRHSLFYRWLPILGSSVTLWIGIALLALAAARAKRRRAAALEAAWQREEEEEMRRRLGQLPPGGTVH